MLLSKSTQHTSSYSSPDYPVLDLNWTGNISFYSTYPGTATFSKAFVLAGNEFVLTLTIAEILNLPAGTYTTISTMSNIPLGITMELLEYATVLDVNLSAATMCKIFGTIEKPDGTPTGYSSTKLVNSVDGVVLETIWKGVDVTATLAAASSDASKIVSVEKIVTATNAAGYFELYVIQGLTVTVTCPSFGKSVAVATTGLTSIDISTFF